ncbi:MAG: type IV pilus assembly protein PilM [Thermodesulfobacteriota bacterium]|nr:type IV pilus assembly protein PilM [Thermodesulfobacteriota bacterium]
MIIPKKNRLVGLDIGSHSIKLVEIGHTKKGRVLKNFGIIGLPPEAIIEGSIKKTQIVSSALKNLFRNLRVKNKNVATSISGYSVIVKKISLRARDKSELEATIHEEAEQYIPFDVNEVRLDFDVLSPVDESAKSVQEGEEGDRDFIEVMLVAAKKDNVDDYVSVLRSAGLTPVVLDVDVFALQNALEISSYEPEGCYALVSVGAEELGINAIKNGVSLFTRDSSYGGSQITEAIMSELNVNFEEAEKIKLGGKKMESEDREMRLQKIVSSTVSDWVNEIKRALDFVGTTYANETMEKIYVCGGASRTPGFKEFLGKETNIPVLDLDPFKNLIINENVFDAEYLRHMAPQAVIAVGLALRSIGDK